MFAGGLQENSSEEEVLLMMVIFVGGSGTVGEDNMIRLNEKLSLIAVESVASTTNVQRHNPTNDIES